MSQFGAVAPQGLSHFAELLLKGSKLADDCACPSNHVADDEGLLLVDALHARINRQNSSEGGVEGGVLFNGQQQGLFLFSKIAVDLDVAALGQITLMQTHYCG